ncbi:MAG: hypothetical protein CMQ20_02795 [Gammaproteobacteria bacterium]|jgi:ribonuclease D|nr:hypothetical protein [Gammaproteobacteria bacterium]|tara:strand:- start:267 stop:482 length:216 start_codon:yes stop_codon:yes gene_type:complete
MWKMTLKQRRRQTELIALLDQLKRDPYSQIPKDYTFGDDPDEDEKYNKVLASFSSVVEELQKLEVAARDGG